MKNNSLSDKNRDIILAKKLSEHTNKFLLKYKIFDLNSLRRYLNDNKCSYYAHVPSFLKENNIIEFSRKGGNGNDNRYSDLYVKVDSEPIHFSLFHELILTCRESSSNNKKNKKHLFEPEILDFKDKSDKELADELRRRGYLVSATKTIEL